MTVRHDKMRGTGVLLEVGSQDARERRGGKSPRTKGVVA
jgi:hypothetical protein